MKHILKPIFLLLVLSCQKTAEEASTNFDVNDTFLSSEQYANMGLTLGELETREMAETIYVSGMADVPPENIAAISLPFSGFVKTFTHNVLTGKYVQKGTVLATVQSMEAVQMQQDYLEKFTQRTLLKQELERQKSMASEEATALRKVQEAENNLKVNEAMLAGLVAKIKIAGLSIERLQQGEIQSSIPLVAPFSGYIKEVHVTMGSQFTPADLLFELINKEHMHVELRVFEKDAFKLKEGQIVWFEDPRIGGKVEGIVFLVGKTFEEESRAVNVHVHLKNKAAEQKLILGQALNATIYLNSGTVPTLPEAAILREDGKTYVYVVDKETKEGISFKKVPVEIGTMQNNRVHVLSPDSLQKVVLSKVTFLAGMNKIEDE